MTVSLPAKISATTSTDPRCRSGPHCSGRTSDGAAITANALCAACVQAIQKCLEELPHLALALRSFLGVTPTTALQSRVRATREPACPIDPRVDALLTEIWDVIDRTGGVRVADLIRQPDMLFTLWVRDERRQEYLSGVDRALDIRRVHLRVNKVIGLDRVWQKRHAPCPDCNLPTLGNWVGDSTVACSDEGCGLILPLDDYESYCTELSRRR